MINLRLIVAASLAFCAPALAQDTAGIAPPYFPDELGGRIGFMTSGDMSSGVTTSMYTVAFEYRHFWNRHFSTDIVAWGYPLGTHIGIALWPFHQLAFQASAGVMNVTESAIDAPVFAPEYSVSLTTILRLDVSKTIWNHTHFVIAAGSTWHVDRDYVSNGGFVDCDWCVPGQPYRPWVPIYVVKTLATYRIEVGMSVGF